MTILYQWQTQGNKPCHACSRWNGQIFYTADSLPELPVHPHCECRVRAFDTYAEAARAAAQKLEDVSFQAKEQATRLERFMLVKFLKHLYSDIQAAIYGFEQIYQTAQIFLRNFEHMKSADTKLADKYFHSKANAQAAQLGKIGEATAKFISDVREFVDSYANVYVKGMSVEASIRDITEDQNANELGRHTERQHPIDEMQEFLERGHLPGVDIEY